ncbi:MAG: hypothetical protein ACLP8S_22355 [Solirubrobacteraceae bacterium]
MRSDSQAGPSGRTKALLGAVAVAPALLMAIVLLVQSSDLSLPGPVPRRLTVTAATIPRRAAGLGQATIERNARNAALTAGWIGVAALLVLGAGLAWVLAAAVRAAARTGEPDLGGGTVAGTGPASPAQGVPAQGVPTQGVPTQGAPTQGAPTQGVPEHATRDREVLVAACVDLADVVSSESLRRRLRDALRQAGVRTIEVEAGCAFDPSSSRVVDRVRTEDPGLNNRVAGTERPGYIDRGQRLRMPEVTVYRLEGDSGG